MSKDYDSYRNEREAERRATRGYTEMKEGERIRGEEQRKKMLAKALREGDKKGIDLWGQKP